MQPIESSLKELMKEAVREVLAEQPRTRPTPQIEKPTLTVAEAAKIVGISTQRKHGQ